MNNGMKDVKPGTQKVVPRNDAKQNPFPGVNAFGVGPGVREEMGFRGNGKAPEASEKPKEFQDMSKTEQSYNGGDGKNG